MRSALAQRPRISRTDYATDWFFGFLRVVEENVQNPYDIKVNLGLNAQLKEILDSLTASRL